MLRTGYTLVLGYLDYLGSEIGQMMTIAIEIRLDCLLHHRCLPMRTNARRRRPLGGRILINTKRLLRYWVFLSLLEVVLDSRFLARLHFSSPRLRARREKSRQILFLRLHLATTPTHPGWPRLDATHCSESAIKFSNVLEKLLNS